MQKLIYFFAAFLLFAGLTCEKKEGFQLGEEFQLKLTEYKGCECGDLSLQAVALKEDSRCPEFTNCVWEGQAIVTFSVEQDGKKDLELILREGRPQMARKVVGAYSYTLTKLDPYPQAGTKIKDEEYVISMIIEKIKS